MRKNFGLLAGLYVMSAMEHAREHQEFIEEINKPIERKKVDLNRYAEEVQPKGTLRYWFNSEGIFLKETNEQRMRKEDCVFKCFSLNDKNAIRKFKKFQNK